MSEVVLRSQMGHTSTAMTQRYAGVHIAAKRSAVAVLEGLVVSSPGIPRRESEEMDTRTREGESSATDRDSRRADYGDRTRDLELGKLALCQLS